MTVNGENTIDAVFEMMVKHASVGIALVDDQGKYCKVNLHWLSIFETAEEKLIGQPFGKLTSPCMGDGWQEALTAYCRQVLTTGIPFSYRGLMLSGQQRSPKYLDWELQRIEQGTRKSALLVTVIDVTDHMSLQREMSSACDILEQEVAERTSQLAQAFAGLAAAERQMRDLLDSITDAIYTIDSKWCVTYYNSASERFGLTKEFIGAEVDDCFYPNPLFEEHLRRAMKDRVAVHCEGYAQKGQRWLALHIYPTKDGGLSIYCRDIHKDKLWEQEASRLDRMNLVGQIAASIGHEVRNPMTTVRGFLQLLDRKETNDKTREYYHLMIDELDRANQIISEFLSLAQNKLVKLRTGNLNHVIQALEPMFKAQATRHMKNIVINLGDIPSIELDEKEIRQLLLNLVSNGLDAVPANGNVLITTFTEGDQVVLSVADNGCGIPEEVQERIGMPFVTSKEDGIGLGLSVCYSIARRHKATIDVQTGAAGTEFKVRFTT